MNPSLKVLILQVAFLLLLDLTSCSPVNTTLGFVQLPFNTSYYKFHKPYNLPVEDRYSFIDGVHKMWVYSNDEPFSKGSPTKPRCEIMINGYEYSSGVWQFEGYGYVPYGTSGVSIIQVFGASPGNTTLMLHVYNGSLSYYSKQSLVPWIYNRWFKLNLIHDVDQSKLEVYIDGDLMFVAPGHGGFLHYYKFGVYGQHNESCYMESRWKDVKIFKKCD